MSEQQGWLILQAVWLLITISVDERILKVFGTIAVIICLIMVVATKPEEN